MRITNEQEYTLKRAEHKRMGREMALASGEEKNQIYNRMLELVAELNRWADLRDRGREIQEALDAYLNAGGRPSV